MATLHYLAKLQLGKEAQTHDPIPDILHVGESNSRTSRRWMSSWALTCHSDFSCPLNPTVEAKKLEHQYRHGLKVKFWGSQR